MINNRVLAIERSENVDRTWTLAAASGSTALSLWLPTFEIDGDEFIIAVEDLAPLSAPKRLRNGVMEYQFGGLVTHRPDVRFEIVYRLADDSPILRFRYRLTSERPRRLTKTNGGERLTYFRTSYPSAAHVHEVQLSQFNGLLHSFCLSENAVSERDFARGAELMGPLLVGSSENGAFLVAYEHGSQVPDAFLRFALARNHEVALRAVKGNYYDGQIIAADLPFETVWMQAGLVEGGEEDLARAYRAFVLRDMSENTTSRSPLIFYNTWAYQERIKAWQKRSYLADMNERRILAEIDIAQRMGIDVFVVDTGWYEKTGDWRVSRERFPNGLAPIKAKLDACGMKLGLWFNPTVAALSSAMRQRHEDCLMTVHGKPHEPHEVWETEASQGLCLVSRYGDAFADELIRLHHEVGVSYFK